MYVPFGVLVFLTPLLIHFLRTSKDRGVSPSYLTMARLVLNVAMVFLPLVIYISDAVNDNVAVDTASKLGPVIEALSFLLAFVLHVACIKRGIVTSGTIFIFWLVKVICQAFTFASLLREDSLLFTNGVDAPKANIIIVEFACCVAMLVLSSWADPPPKYIYMDGKNVLYLYEPYGPKYFFPQVISANLPPKSIPLSYPKLPSLGLTLWLGKAGRASWYPMTFTILLMKIGMKLIKLLDCYRICSVFFIIFQSCRNCSHLG